MAKACELLTILRSAYLNSALTVVVGGLMELSVK